MESVVLSPDLLLELSITILRALGLSGEEARVVADTLVEADLQGVGTHGVVRLAAYADRVAAGGLNPRAEMRVVHESATCALLDAGNGFGQLAAYLAMQMAAQKAAESGVGIISVRHSNHFGRAGYYSEWIARQDMIGIAMSNASPRLAPWGGKKPMLGNNPWSIAVPTDQEPIVLDMANSMVAAGKIRQAAQRGEPIPAGWALDADGRPTTDPVRALQGVLLPFGSYKGYGITLMVGILTGVLSGGGWDAQVVPVDAAGWPQQESHLVAAIRLRDFIQVENFKEQVAAVIRQIKGCPPAESSPGVFIPGEIEHARRVRALREGVPVALPTYRMLGDLARRLGVPLPGGWPS